MHKKSLTLIIILIALVITGYFVYFSLPLNIPLDVQLEKPEKEIPVETEQTDTATTTPEEESQTQATSTQSFKAPTSTPPQDTADIPAPEIESEPDPLPSANRSTNNRINVSFTIDGFSPANVEISKGTTIIFTNDSTKPMWVASDNHPHHDILPELDQKGVAMPTETYEFTFDKLGSWPYHNHLIPTQKGTITVK